MTIVQYSSCYLFMVGDSEKSQSGTGAGTKLSPGIRFGGG